MADIELDIPDITVVVSNGTEYLANINIPDITVVIISGTEYLANINIFSAVPITEDNYFVAADYATTALSASYAATASVGLVAKAVAVESGSIGILLATEYTGSFTGSLTGQLIGTASYAATASNLLNVNDDQIILAAQIFAYRRL